MPYRGAMPRDTLTRDQIVRTAIDLLDSEGLEGLNMRALGERLGSAATAMYWHVGSKEQLIAMAADAAWMEISLPDLGTVDWRRAAAAMARELYAMLLRHPWVLQAFGSFLLFGRGKARYDEHSLAIYEEAAGFDGAEAGRAMAAVFTFVLGNALGPAAETSLTRKLGRSDADGAAMREGMARAREIAAEFPRLHARIGTAADEYGAAPENTFEFGLEAILDSLEARRPARSVASTTSSPE
jgi:AcrR family transcriptional regulator